MRAVAFASDPKIDGGYVVTFGDHGLGEVELAVEFERAGLHREGARGGSGLGGLVDDANLDAEPGQPKRQHQTGRAGTDDQNVVLRHPFLHITGFKAERIISMKPKSASDLRVVRLNILVDFPHAKAHL